MISYRMGKWQLVLYSILILLLLINPLWADSGRSPGKIVIGYMTVPNPLTVAKELGWVEKTVGIPVEWKQYQSGRHVLKAIINKDVDLTHIGSTPCAAGIANGLPIEVVWVSAVIADGEALVVNKNAGIEDLADLAGKKVATPFQSTSHYALKVALKLAKVEESRMEIVNLDPAQMLTAWENNEIQAGYVWNPTLTHMVETGGKILMSSKELALRGFPTADLFVARKDFAEKHPNLVFGVVNDLSRAADLCRSDPAKASEAVAKGLAISPPKALKEMEGMIFLTVAEQKVGLYIGKLQWEFGLYTLLKEAADFLAEEGAIEKSPPWPAFRRSINSLYIEEIYKKVKRPKY